MHYDVLNEPAVLVEEIDQIGAAEDGYWTTAEAAKFLGKSERTIRRLLQTGVLDGCKIAGLSGQVWRVTPVDGVDVGAASDITNFGIAGDTTDVFQGLVSDYRARESMIECLNEKIHTLEEQLEQNRRLYMNALQRIDEYERKEVPMLVERQPAALGWWREFRLNWLSSSKLSSMF
ncbi:hypothetical protein BH10CYA1_BH10CYA1_47420 [soil metagenome]